ncbi:hypothetical protein DFH11DRAFT_1639162 [Phellopilus nigrolimitatus]|nr:hypothetical protein DFH11DRAFT_1639162 [Phellopilus nigrolimitatus]
MYNCIPRWTASRKSEGTNFDPLPGCAEQNMMVTDDIDMKTQIEKVPDETGNTGNRAQRYNIQ